MNENHLIYELTDEQRETLAALFSASRGRPEATAEDKAKIEQLCEDVARLGGYLKDRADAHAREQPGASERARIT